VQIRQHATEASAIGASVRVREPEKDIRVLDQARAADARDGKQKKEGLLA
jgi:hypothetical protein